MKVLLTIVFLFSSVTAFASDRLEDEIVCNKVTAPGEADNGMTFVLQSTATAWTKNVAITENGWAGPRTIANIQVPLTPIVRGGNGYIPEDILTYEGNGLVLEIRALRIEGRPLNGGLAKLSLANYESETITLTCEYVR